MEALGCKQQHGLHCSCTTEHIVSQTKHGKKPVVGAKSYREGLINQERAFWQNKVNMW